jgi:hypothetical protein
MVLDPWPLFYRRRWRRQYFGQCYSDELLHHVTGASDIDAKAEEQRQSQAQLNDNDRGDRICALPRPRHSIMLCVSGQDRARLG